ncbi:hypothetical protein C8Q73DRAFT_76129 [Cubamyces lactineus]|nr:hypothetical protein C8Q73DRAFT_76129 [Cubamyces lactineus]
MAYPDLSFRHRYSTVSGAMHPRTTVPSAPSIALCHGAGPSLRPEVGETPAGDRRLSRPFVDSILPRLSPLLPLASSRYPLPRRPRTIISAIYSRLVVGPPLCVFGACIADRRLGCGMSCWRHDRVVQATMCIIY